LHFGLSQFWLTNAVIEAVNNKRRLAFLRERAEKAKLATKPE
jgi:hypothetical protein